MDPLRHRSSSPGNPESAGPLRHRPPTGGPEPTTPLQYRSSSAGSAGPDGGTAASSTSATSCQTGARTSPTPDPIVGGAAHATTGIARRAWRTASCDAAARCAASDAAKAEAEAAARPRTKSPRIARNSSATGLSSTSMTALAPQPSLTVSTVAAAPARGAGAVGGGAAECAVSSRRVEADLSGSAVSISRSKNPCNRWSMAITCLSKRSLTIISIFWRRSCMVIMYTFGSCTCAFINASINSA
mmetsp:Transcript_20914/g.60344  ORF Transcript_20914/g.60344 Transcript_20914/m.60344 type:complete len:244 (+) Transcript_20914:179-910(+)